MIRRLSFDLTGIPPSPDEINAFVNDTEPDAYNRLVERLLASPHYGERWGKYWLEASGYSDSNGYFSADSDRPLAYRYRDYVIRAFNADRPLDQIVREQLAGDELAGERQSHYASNAVIDQLVATHFLRNGQDGTGESDGNPDEVRADKYAVLEGAIQIIGSSLLGLTLQCAKCHDHKFEPVTQKDYYQLQAILFPAFNVEHWVKPNDRVVIAGPRAEQVRWEAHDKAIDAQIESLKRSFASEPGAAKKEKALKKVIEAINARRQPNPGRIAWVGDVSGSPSEIPLLVRGDLATPGSESRAGRSRFLDRPRQPIQAQAAVSRLILDRQAAGACAVAHSARHAAGGSSGSRAGQPNLAAPFRNRTGRHIGQSRVHGLSAHSSRVARVAGSRAGALGLERQGPASPDPVLLGVSAIELSKSTGFAASILTTACSRGFLSGDWMPRRSVTPCSPPPVSWIDRQGGPYVPTDRTGSGDVVVAERSPGATRRSVYLQQRRTQTDSLLEVFDAPSIVTTCTRRSPSTIPLQSLSLLNSDFVIDPRAEARRAA